MKMFKVLWNSFFIQSAWSFENMQAMGFAFAISPALKKIYKEKNDFLSALKRHMKFFNTQPYMAAPIIGAVIRLEQDVKAGKLSPNDVSLFKKSLMGPYGAIGDAYFWGSLKPFASVFGVVFLALSSSLWASAAFLIIYNIPHLWMRTRGLTAGCNMGIDVVDYIKSLDIPEWGKRLRYLTICLLGAALALYYQMNGYASANIGSAVGIFSIVLFFAYLMQKGFSASMLVYIVFILCAAYWYAAPVFHFLNKYISGQVSVNL
ncbi:MAG: PTS system mannose/fructose/sorbose family transporter subunit IID [Deltaproteobacteria bacterium]|nr:PTS system mannose/fructose/sorbose family transporter subunit IID [Deltaproteobacteria bacterium]